MDTLNDLKQFYEKIVKYKRLAKQWSNTFFPTDDLRENIENLRSELQRDYSFLEEAIAFYGGGDSVLTEPIFGRKQNVFDFAFDAFGMFTIIDCLNALNKVIQIVNRAIGKLEAEGGSWNVPVRKLRDKPQKPKAFISHSGNTQALTELRDYLDELGIEKLIVVQKPNLDREINLKVEAYLDEADFVIILATGDSKDRNGNIIPSGNVLHEIGLAQAKPKFKGKIIYLLEEIAEFPSNIRPKLYIRFNRDNIEYKFGDIVKEIKKMGFLS